MDALSEVGLILRSLQGIWDEEAVDELDHALQAAAHAQEDGADDELVLAAALHDLGHSPLLGGPHVTGHERIARDWLTERFGERVGWLAGAHVAAKRYLAATDPDYRLSDTSLTSLHHQGGPGVDADTVNHPWFPDALRLRRYDDAAKDPQGRGLTVDEVLAIAKRVAGTAK
ncbi:HD domain-containing protein [Mycolicibacterium goodii]|uniref:HD domain-containing protein n=1 Tax=Mycolicibacterium goodii TaxID=134601 RepID=A0ABS6HJE8_MYCGD|nr:HD domain-containing protein [Mycolicibacterium goodii]OKH72073.1 HD family phosphohydrolase [Mycobacterium sp. SWH-M5]MBU8812885.1 HD domain-containing protein [Mycolicibacterium goodii]MBU8822811.1 HD domain-containing protein [Mycolicibacterium goodii]MBU8829140.1 HD domain-containing protein [Mycolicibacterium goodii]MBU8838905.1 HD domain-containing protein [Mycolicibacterium goodii]